MVAEKRIKKYLPIVSLLLLGFLIRIIFAAFEIESGDILVFAEWGKRFKELGAANFYTKEGWYYSFPTYPPLSSLLFGGIYWLFEHNYVLSQIHNLVKVIPSSFILYINELFGNPLYLRRGYLILLKAPSISGDIALGGVIYFVVRKLVEDEKKALLASAFYVLNPVTIFLSSIWGQTEGLVAFFGFLAFYFLSQKKFTVSAPLFFVSLYLKPTWAIFVPLYLVIAYFAKPKLRGVVLGIVITLAIFLASTIPFSGPGVLSFLKSTVLGNILPSAKGAAKASNSAINFHTVFFKMDKTLSTKPLNYFGYFSFILLNVYSFFYLKKQKKDLLKTSMSLMFVVGFGSFLFLTNMLERYFFASFVPMIVLIFTDTKLFFYGVLINAVTFVNLVWIFFRRKSDELNSVFVAFNSFVVKILSFVVLYSWYKIAARGLFFKEFNKLMKRKPASVKI